MSPASRTVVEARGDREIVIQRTFDAPAELVFDAWTKPGFVRRWWAPAALGVEPVRFEADLRAGGSYRYVVRAPAVDELGAGAAFAMSGRYVEVVRPSRLVYTEVFEPTADGPEPGAQEVVVTVTFEEDRGRTHVVSLTVCPSKEARDGYLTAAEAGTSAAMDQLDDLLRSLRSQ